MDAEQIWKEYVITNNLDGNMSYELRRRYEDTYSFARFKLKKATQELCINILLAIRSMKRR